jgi:hypothetical protein
MKKLIYTALVTITLSSCSPTVFFQVYEAYSKDVQFDGDIYKYEDDFIIIGYNLWDSNGDIGFYFYNKTDSAISIDLAKSYYVVNATAFDYYQQRISTNSFTNITHFDSYYYNYYGVYYKKSAVSTGSSSQISYREKSIINIPPNAGKSISEYSIVSELYRDCNLYRFPKKKSHNSVTFNETDSPLKFYNYLTYSFDGDLENKHVIKNEFWVTQITNYTKDQMVEYKYNEYCNERSFSKYKYFIKTRKDRFYHKYTKADNMVFKH